MPTYRVFNDSFDAEYCAQRPSSAACKGLTSLRRKDSSIDSVVLSVQATSKKTPMRFRVEYKEIQDDFLGLLKRPVATKLEDTI
jgi:hypothetical protein